MILCLMQQKKNKSKNNTVNITNNDIIIIKEIYKEDYENSDFFEKNEYV